MIARVLQRNRAFSPAAFVIVLLMTGPALFGQPGLITVVAGGGPSRTLKDGDVATNGQLSLPSSVALDSTGNVYIADGSVRKVNLQGIISTVAGGINPPASAGAEWRRRRASRRRAPF